MADNLPSPYELLVELDKRSRQVAFGLPQQTEVKETWDGIGFRLNKTVLVAPMSEVRELLEYPKVTQVPGTVSWVRGIANIRGNLLPVLDLHGLLFNEVRPIQPRTRLLVVAHDAVSAGLQVDEMLGMRHFFVEDHTDQLPDVDERLKPFLNGSFSQNDQLWGVLSISKLLDSPDFMKVAA